MLSGMTGEGIMVIWTIFGFCGCKFWLGGICRCNVWLGGPRSAEIYCIILHVFLGGTPPLIKGVGMQASFPAMLGRRRGFLAAQWSLVCAKRGVSAFLPV